MIEQSLNGSFFSAANALFIEELYDAYLKNPESVPADWHDCFASLRAEEKAAGSASAGVRVSRWSTETEVAQPGQEERALTAERKQIAVLQMINAYRFLGVRHADLDPLAHQEKPHIPELDPAYHGLTEADMNTVFGTGSLIGPPRAPLAEILQILRQTYCGKIGVEYMYITDTEQKRWIQSRIEGSRAQPQYSAEYKRYILERLNAAEGLEKYLHTRYVGQKRFSGEGGWHDTCSSILALTKVDWNNNTLYKALPVTLVYSQIFADVVKQSPDLVNDIYDYRFFM